MHLDLSPRPGYRVKMASIKLINLLWCPATMLSFIYQNLLQCGEPTIFSNFIFIVYTKLGLLLHLMRSEECESY